MIITTFASGEKNTMKRTERNEKIRKIHAACKAWQTLGIDVHMGSKQNLATGGAGRTPYSITRIWVKNDEYTIDGFCKAFPYAVR